MNPPPFVSFQVLPHDHWGSRLYALGANGKIYVEEHRISENREISFWVPIEWILESR